MEPVEAHKILEPMAIDMTGALGSMKKSEPMADVLEQRLTAVNEAQKALHKQIPQKPLPYRGWEGQCPSCNVVFVDRLTAYCGNCGQQLDWTGGET